MDCPKATYFQIRYVLGAAETSIINKRKIKSLNLMTDACTINGIKRPVLIQFHLDIISDIYDFR